MSTSERVQADWLGRNAALVAGPGEPLALAPLAEAEAEPEAEL
jgi:hypothetical protein